MISALIAVLYAVSIAMIGSGVYIAITGYEIILVERGWTQVIAGSVLFSGGAVLFGIACAILVLAGISRSLKQVQVQPGKTLPGFVSDEAGTSSFPGIGAVESHSDKSAAFGSALSSTHWNNDPLAPEQETMAFKALDVKVPEAVASDDLPAIGSDFALDLEDEIAREVAAHNAQAGTGIEEEISVTEEVTKETSRTEFNIPFPSKPPSVSYPPFGGSEIKPLSWEENDVIADDAETVAEPAPVTPPAIDVPAAAEKVSDTEKEMAPEESTDRKVVGSYDSGGNRYVMYSDGSIEAHLPDGIHTFKSLDELKQFVNNIKSA